MMNSTLANDSRQNLLAMYSDIHKDAYGSRPRNWEEITQKTDAELIEDIEYLSKIAEREMEEERKAEVAAKLRWEEHIARLMQESNVNRATALRWDMEAMDADGDVGFYIFLWGMSYSLEDELRTELKNCG